MRNFIRAVFFTIAFLMTAGLPVRADENRPEFGKYFDRHQVIGTFVLYDQNDKKFIRYNPERARKGFVPASTFKIANSLIGLETGIITGEDYVFKWNGEKRLLDIWNRDLSLNRAFNSSCLPCYQGLAREIGHERMKKWVKKLKYGNADISGGIDQFWLTGGLRISADEEVEFLRRLYNSKLPLKQTTMDTVKKIMLREDNGKYKLSYKTGWQTDDLKNSIGSKSLGWIVGYLETGGNVHYFATNIETDDTRADFAASRMEITRQILKDLKLL
ncbi:MAG: class D beta-lactamase [Pyrinomonadaceae bacterium]